jgi:hypothetical protein
MSPDLIFFAIRSLIRVGYAARDAYEQSVRDADFSMPPLPSIEYGDDRYKPLVKQPDGPLSRYWDPVKDTCLNTDEAKDALLTYASMLREQSVENNNEWRWQRWCDEDTVVSLAQWNKKDGPLEPWEKIGLALADVVLDYLKTVPNATGLNGNAEILVKAFVGNLSSLLPDPNNTARAYFVERLGVALLQSGLKAINDNAAAVTDSAALQALIGNISKPLVDLFAEADPLEQLTWLNIRDTVFPKLVQAGIETLAAHQKELLGRDFDPNKLAGAMTSAFLKGLVQSNLTDLGKAEAWLPVYRSLLDVIATRPGLVIGASTEPFFQQLLANVATQLKDVPPPFNQGRSVDLVGAVVGALSKDVPWVKDERWDATVVAVVKQVADGLKNGAGAGGLTDRATVTAILQTVLGTIATTPGMVLGNDSSKEVQAIVGVIARAMSTDTHLLTKPDWQRIAAVAAAEAARNPARLFKINDPTPEAQLANAMIQAILNTVSSDLANGRAKGAVLFGQTLVDAICETLKVAAGNATKAMANQKKLETLIANLNALAQSNDPTIGAEEWLWLFRKLVAGVLDGGKADYTPQELSDMLYRKAKP